MEKKRVGRPRKTDEPAFPAEELDTLLVHGEEVSLEGGKQTTGYPSFRDLAERYGIAVSTVASFSKKNNCMERRKRAREDLQEKLSERITKIRADTLAITLEDQIRAIDRYMMTFEEGVIEGRVRAENAADYNTVARLREFLLGAPDSRQATDGLPTLEEMQRRHMAALEQERNATPETSGRLPLHAIWGGKANADGDGSEIGPASELSEPDAGVAAAGGEDVE